MGTALKRIVYRGGVVTFNVPETILESQEEDPEVLETMKLVNAEVNTAQLAKVLGS